MSRDTRKENNRSSSRASSGRPSEKRISSPPVSPSGPVRKNRRAHTEEDEAASSSPKRRYTSSTEKPPQRRKTSDSAYIPSPRGRKPESRDGERIPFPISRKPGRRSSSSDEAAPYHSAKRDTRNTFRREDEEVEEVEDYSNLRLNKFLAHCGIASRRKADEIISAGRVTVNGVVIESMGHRVSITDKIKLDGQAISPEKKVYILLNKPKDYITTTRDERDRRTVMDLIKPALRQIGGPHIPRLYPIGRLDRNTTGVLLITNDGALAQNLTHPSKNIRKVYHVFLDKKLSPSDFEKIAIGGVVLEDGIAEVDAIAFPNPKSRQEIGLEIHTGKNRFVRRLFESLGYEVVKLDRVAFSEFTKKDIPRGKFRFLTENEVRNLKHFLV